MAQEDLKLIKDRIWTNIFVYTYIFWSKEPTYTLLYFINDYGTSENILKSNLKV